MSDNLVYEYSCLITKVLIGLQSVPSSSPILGSVPITFLAGALSDPASPPPDNPGPSGDISPGSVRTPGRGQEGQAGKEAWKQEVRRGRQGRRLRNRR